MGNLPLFGNCNHYLEFIYNIPGQIKDILSQQVTVAYTSENKGGGHPTRQLPFFPQKTHKKAVNSLRPREVRLPGHKGHLLSEEGAEGGGGNTFHSFWRSQGATTSFSANVVDGVHYSLNNLDGY